MNTNNLQNIPNQLRYNYVRPQGFSSQYQQWIVNPMGGQNRIQPTQILRYQLNLTDGFFDPQRSYFDIQVSTQIPTGCLQIDGSAFGFISQSLLLSGASQIQRITQYDQVAQILLSTGVPQMYATGRQYQGIGRSFFQNIPKALPTCTSSSSVGFMNYFNSQTTQITSIADFSGGSLFNPLFINQNQSSIGGSRMESWAPNWHNPVVSSQKLDSNKKSKWNNIIQQTKYITRQNIGQAAYSNQGLMFYPPTALGMTPSLVSQLNVATLCSQYYWNVMQQWTNGVTVSRAQYNLTSASSRYIDTKQSVCRNVMYGKTKISDFDPVNPNVKYDIDFYDHIYCHYVDSSSKDSVGNDIGPTNGYVKQPNTCGINGFQMPYSMQLSVGCDQPFISTTIPQCAMQNGNILPRMIPISTKRFITPFLSAVMGIQIPKQSYALLPLKAFFNAIIQLTLNKYAMFSSGYNDRSIWDKTGMSYPIQRNFFFKKFNYVLQIYNFNDQYIKNYAMSSLQRGIVFSTQILNMSMNFMVANQLQLRGTWTVNTTAGSITHVILRFLDNSYLQYPFLRKQYSLSCNITSFQIKFDTKWYPPQPIVGNAGNPQYIDTTGNVQPYLNMLYNSGDWLFNAKAMPIINSLNFCINGRCFDFTNTNSYLQCSNKPGDKWHPNTFLPQQWVNTDTAMGMSWFHQNRCVGRALYIYAFQPMGHSLGMVNGLNAGKSRPFQIILNTSVVNPNMNQIGFYVFIKSHQIVQLTQNGIRTSGVGQY